MMNRDAAIAIPDWRKTQTTEVANYRLRYKTDRRIPCRVFNVFIVIAACTGWFLYEMYRWKQWFATESLPTQET